MVSFGDIARVNLDKSTHDQVLSSDEANDRIETLNKCIHSMNDYTVLKMSRSPSSPFLATAVSRMVWRKDKKRSKKYRVFYTNNAMLRDGIHLSESCKKLWIKTFIKCFSIDLNSLK